VIKDYKGKIVPHRVGYIKTGKAVDIPTLIKYSTK
jgi:hypothetical protein